MIRKSLIAASVLLASASFAQETAPAPDKAVSPAPARTAPAAHGSTQMARVNDGFQGINIGMLIKRCGLSTEQTQLVKDLNADSYREYRTLPQDLPIEERKAKVKTMMAERETKLSAILTPDQQKQYATAQAEMDARRQAFDKAQPTAPAVAPEKK